MKSRMRRVVTVLGVTRALAVIGVTAGPGLAQGPSHSPPRRAGLDVLRPARPRGRSAVLQPGSESAVEPAAGEDGRVIHGRAMEPVGEFERQVHLARTIWRP